jgi:hypothetical protein
MEVRELGEHTLRDLAQPERLFQLVVAGLPDVFPPPRSEHEPKAPPPDRSILIIREPDAASERLVEVGVPLARSHPPHELIVAQLVDAALGPAGDLEGALARASSDLHELRADLVEQGISARVAAFTTVDSSEDIVRLSTEQAVDLVLLERSPESLKGGRLGQELEAVFANAPCDVAVCLLRNVRSDSDVVLVPFGGGAHDWTALELGAWIARANGFRLRLLGIAGDPTTGKRDASRLLAAASLSVQQLVGVPTEPVLRPAGGQGLVDASEDVAVLVAGVPDDWRERGLGQVRSELAHADRATTLFVRRGVRPGGLAPRDSLTRFTWSLADAQL